MTHQQWMLFFRRFGYEPAPEAAYHHPSYWRFDGARDRAVFVCHEEPQFWTGSTINARHRGYTLLSSLRRDANQNFRFEVIL